MLHVGMDMHKRYSVVTVTDDEGNELVSGRRLENDDKKINDFLIELDGDVRVVMEAGPSWHWMCDLLDEMGIDNKLSHPLKTKAIASARIKTDKIDSSILSNLLRMNFIPEAYKPDIETRHLRELLRYRAYLVKMRTGIKNKVHALLTKLNIGNPYTDLFGKAGTRFLHQLDLPPVHRRALDGYLGLIDDIDREISRADKQVDRALDKFPQAELLATIPGVGRILSLTILAEIADINRFPSAKQLASYSGLVPSTSQSGNTVRHGRITRQGSRWLRWALIEATVNVARYPGPLKDHYLKLRKRKGNKIARVACARKLCTYIYHMLKEGKDYHCVASYLKSDLG